MVITDRAVNGGSDEADDHAEDALSDITDTSYIKEMSEEGDAAVEQNNDNDIAECGSPDCGLPNCGLHQKSSSHPPFKRDEEVDSQENGHGHHCPSIQVGGDHIPTNGPSYRASVDSKYRCYNLLVNHSQQDKSVEIALCTIARPHMRAFHFSWISFFVAFFSWFAISPLLSEVQESLSLTKEQIWTSSICGVASTAIVRLTVGPYCDKYGARMCTLVLLVLSGIPTMCLGLVKGSIGLSVVRFMIGVAGATFVTCQYWTSSMFTREVAGTANALVAGWGNLGGGVAQIVMGSMLFPLFKWYYGLNTPSDGGRRKLPAVSPEERAWRSVCIIPGAISIISAFILFKYSDDCPKGNYQARRRLGLTPDVNVYSALKSSVTNINTWLLFVQYGCSFGVEITMSNAAALYFKEEFDQSTESAAAIASVFGWMNIFARGFGGFMSDITNASNGMRGRLIWHVICFILEGVTLVIFSRAKHLAGAICAMAVFSIFVQALEGSTFGIVPYVKPHVTGSVAGTVGAGGSVGGVLFSVLFRQFEYRRAFLFMGLAIIFSSIITAFIFIPGHAGLMCGMDAPEVSRLRELQQSNSQISQLEEQDHVTPQVTNVDDSKKPYPNQQYKEEWSENKEVTSTSVSKSRTQYASQ